MSNYYVVVSHIEKPGTVDAVFSGRLWATHTSDAEIEAGRYREKLNGVGGTLNSLKKKFRIVMMVNTREVKQYRGYTKWWKNRVTPNPKVRKKRAKPEEITW